jgi:hypothetical protein
LVPTTFEPDLWRCRLVGHPADPALPGRVCRIVLRRATPMIHRESELVERRALACSVYVGPHRDHPLMLVVGSRELVVVLVRDASRPVRFQ